MAEQLINFTPSNQDFDVFEARLIRVSTLHSETCQYLSHPLVGAIYLVSVVIFSLEIILGWELVVRKGNE